MPAVDISLRTSTKTALFPARTALIVSRIWGSASGVADAPTSVVAVAGDGQVSISWTRSPDPTTAPVTGYLITCEGGGATQSVSAASSSTVFTGLTNGTYYTFIIQALNRFGSSAGSTPTTPIAPVAATTIPGVPQNFTATGVGSSGVLSWQPPASTGGTAITSYTISGLPGGDVVLSGTSGAYIANGLANGTYSLTIKAANAVGSGPSTSPVSMTISAVVVISLTNATSTSPTQVTLTFSTPPGLSVDAYDPNKWTITGVGSLSLPVYAVSIVGSTVVLETGLQLGGEVYTVTCPNGIVNAATGAPQTAPFSHTFTGQGGSPSVLMARSVDATLLEVIYSMPVNVADAMTPSNYTITPTLSVLGAVQISPVIFRLTTSRQLVGVNYGVSVSGIRPGP